MRAFDKDKDVVVLQLGRMIAGTVEWPENLPFLTMGSSKNVAVGDRIADWPFDAFQDCRELEEVLLVVG